MKNLTFKCPFQNTDCIHHDVFTNALTIECCKCEKYNLNMSVTEIIKKQMKTAKQKLSNIFKMFLFKKCNKSVVDLKKYAELERIYG